MNEAYTGIIQYWDFFWINFNLIYTTSITTCWFFFQHMLNVLFFYENSIQSQILLQNVEFDLLNFWNLFANNYMNIIQISKMTSILFSNFYTDLLFTDVDTIVSVKILNLHLQLSNFFFNNLFLILKLNFLILIILNFFCFTRANNLWIKYINFAILSKYLLLNEAEKELGSLDDFIFFFVFFFCIFGWYFLSTIFITLSFSLSFSNIWIILLILNCFVLLIPTSMLLDFGIYFACYIRGAGNSTNPIVEIIFDLISCLIIFIRFIVQNIRFVLIFMALFELYEWIYLTPNKLLTTNILDFWFLISSSPVNSLTSGYYFVTSLLFGLLFYFYYALHLLILLFIQIGAYFLLSFWLFFFLYTSFFLVTQEKYFFYKRLLS